jgi:hypothetical protein
MPTKRNLTEQQREDLGRMRMAACSMILLIVLVLACVGVTVTCWGAEMAEEYVFAVVARNDGIGAARWRSSLCMTNPQWTWLNVEARLIQDGIYTAQVIDVGPNQTRCSDDFLLEWFGLERFQGGMILVAEPAANPDLVFLHFTPSLRVYNPARGGSFGTGVDPVPVFGPADPRGFAWPWGQSSGIVHWGAPGEAGFRAAVGIFNPTRAERTVDFWLREANGNIVWEMELEAPPLSQKQWQVPDGAVVDHGSVTMQDPLWRDKGRPPVYGYATVVDNLTGDGVYIPTRSPFEFQVVNDE